MKVADEIAHRALAYVAAGSRHGYPLSVSELKAFTNSPARKSNRWAAITLSQLAESGGRPEPVVDWLKRLRWLRVDGQTVTLTPLGNAVLASLDEADVEPDTPVLVAPSEDSLAYPRVIGMIADRGEALLADPYFKLESLPHVLHYTHVTRLLVGPRADCEELAVAYEAIPEGRAFEIRVSDSIHDRFILPPSGPVDHLGTSLSGLGKRLTVTSSIAPPAADAIRAEVEKLWSVAATISEAASKGQSAAGG